ncbi:MAG: hypothetical protein RTV31_17040 [Candidatus Thorarchaeota archaeon]
MHDNRQRVSKALKVESTISYPFPTMIGIFASFLVVAFYSVLGMRFFQNEVYLHSDWNSTLVGAELDATLNIINSKVVTASFLNLGTIVMFFVPLLFAFNYAQGFSNGQIRTLLSYPIGRLRLFFAKTGVIVLLLSFSMIVAGTLSLASLYPYSINFEYLILMSVGSFLTVLIISSTCVFIATFSRNAPVTAVLGLGLWAIGFVVTVAPFSPIFLKQLFFPWILTLIHIDSESLSYMGSASINTVVTGWLITSSLSLILIIISLIRFYRLEV